MRLLRPAAVRRADARPAVIIIIACLGVFAILGLILVATLLIGLRRSATTAAASAPGLWTHATPACSVTRPRNPPRSWLSTWPR